MMRAVRKHTDCPGVLLYSDRGLRAPVQMPDGTLVNREKKTKMVYCKDEDRRGRYPHDRFDFLG
jgi:hypothetical protein